MYMYTYVHKLYMYRVIQYIQYLEEMLLKVCRLIGSFGEVESMLCKNIGRLTL